MTAAGPRLVLATHNQHKVTELRAIMDGLVPGLEPTDIVGAADLGVPAPREDGLSFAENALIKARALAKATGLVAIADDSGLEVDVMNGAPGIFSARWAGTHSSDQANLDLLLAQIADVPDEARGAQFTCAAVVVSPDGTEVVKERSMRGVLLREPAGSGGFGYDPIFQADGQDRTNAELSAAEKNAISHRGAALRALVPHVVALLSERR